MQNLKNRKSKVNRLSLFKIFVIALLFLMPYQSVFAAIVLGNPNGSIVISFVYDYECLYCQNTYPAIKRIISNDRDICLKLFPVAIINQISIVKAAAAVVATKTPNQFKPLNDYLFANNPISLDEFLGKLKTQNLYSESFLKSMHDSWVKEQLDQGLTLLRKYNLHSAPLLIISSTRPNVHLEIPLAGEQTNDTLMGAINHVRNSS